MLLEEFFNYKNTLMETLCTNENIVKLVTGDDNPVVPNHALPYKNIFPFEFVPDTTDDSKTFICYDVDILDIESKTFLYPVVYIWVFTHKSNIRLEDGGVRLDELTKAINKELNGSRCFGLGELSLKHVTRFVPTTDYLGRCLTYVAKDFNAPTVSKPLPKNRRFK